MASENPMPPERKPTVVRGEETAAERRTTEEVVVTGTTAEAIGGAGAVVLAIIGLAGALPVMLAAVGTIAAGGALFLRGTTMVARYGRLSRDIAHGSMASAELGGGVSAEMIGGMAGIALGILALVGVDPLPLLAIAVIVFGGTLLIGSGVTARVNELAMHGAGAEGTLREIARESVRAAAGAQVLVGIGAITLGILALVGVAPLSLILVGVLSVGGAELLTGSALGARLASSLS